MRNTAARQVDHLVLHEVEARWEPVEGVVQVVLGDPDVAGHQFEIAGFEVGFGVPLQAVERLPHRSLRPLQLTQVAEAFGLHEVPEPGGGPLRLIVFVDPGRHFDVAEHVLPIGS